MLNFNIINIDKPISYVIMARTPLYMKFDTRYCYAYVNSLCWGVDGCVCIYVCMIQAGGVFARHLTAVPLPLRTVTLVWDYPLGVQRSY